MAVASQWSRWLEFFQWSTFAQRSLTRAVGIFQSLIATCRLQGIDLYTYLVDVLQRVDDHPASDVAALTPRLWKDRFAGDPRRSAIDRAVNNAVP